MNHLTSTIYIQEEIGQICDYLEGHTCKLENTYACACLDALVQLDDLCKKLRTTTGHETDEQVNNAITQAKEERHGL